MPPTAVTSPSTESILTATAPSSGTTVTAVRQGDVCSNFYRGDEPASEPETRAIEAYLRDVFGDQRGQGYNDPAPEDTNGVFISLHSFGRLLFYPWEHSSTPAPNRDELRRLGRKMGYFPDYRVCNPELCMYRFRTAARPISPTAPSASPPLPTSSAPPSSSHAPTSIPISPTRFSTPSSTQPRRPAVPISWPARAPT